MQAQPYVVFARKYRPNSFVDLKGQQVLVQVLNSAISHARLAQAYLLTGIRGVGKTTSARIIAKTINCTALKTIDTLITPCGTCNNCVSAQAMNHPDIVEMDAASKTSVEDVRNIIDDAQYKPLIAKYKVFIIDEIHMLSKNAFNALLKLLEEPPPHLIFIFATTEVNKIPITVISRCQRFDLKRLNSTELTNLLVTICNKEQLKYDIEALKIIALKADGSARDAVSMLDQAVSLTYGQTIHNQAAQELSLAIVENMVGTTNYQITVELVAAIINKDVKKALQILQEAYFTGTDLVILTENMLDFIASLTKSKTMPDYKSEVFANYSTIIKTLAEQSSLTWLLIVWQIITKGLVDVKNSYNEFLSIEMLVIKAIHATMLPSPKALIEKIITSQSANQPQDTLDDNSPRQVYSAHR